MRIQTARGLCDGRGLRCRCDDEARPAASLRAQPCAGWVHTETKLAREFWADVAGHFYLHTLAASDERSFYAVARLGQVRLSVGWVLSKTLRLKSFLKSIIMWFN